MTKAQSLRLLSEWAVEARQNDPKAYGYPSSPADDVKRHGAAAVRAIRAAENLDPIKLSTAGKSIALFVAAKRESRLAFRAALSAVGIKGAL